MPQAQTLSGVLVADFTQVMLGPSATELPGDQALSGSCTPWPAVNSAGVSIAGTGHFALRERLLAEQPHICSMNTAARRRCPQSRRGSHE